jgi:hypothetical protein
MIQNKIYNDEKYQKMMKDYLEIYFGASGHPTRVAEIRPYTDDVETVKDATETK